MSNATEDHPPSDDAGAEGPDEVTPYKRRIGITLAILALLGGWIALLATNAGTNESRTTREATRLAAEAQTARILAKGVDATVEQIEATQETFGDRAPFQLDAAERGLDPEAQASRLAEGQAAIDAAIGDTDDLQTEVGIRARELTLEQAAVTDERITWNARASQYETVVATLAVAIFLIGFTLVVGRKLRPPFALPGLLLALYCFGWAVHIYNKPIPDVDRDAITATAVGEVALGEGRSQDAADAFGDAIDLDDDYAPPHAGLATALMAEANPDLLTTLAFTDVDPTVIDAATTAIDRAIELDDEARANQTLAGLIAIAAADWDQAATRIDEAKGGNDMTPGLQLSRAVVAVAQGDEDTATEMLDLVREQSAALAESDTARTLTAQYLTLLEWVELQAPEQAALVDRFRTEAVIGIAAGNGGLDATTGGDPSLTVVSASFDDGKTTVDLDAEGIEVGTQVAIVGYELPAEGAAFVQPAQLLFIGPPRDAAGFTLATPRNCTPIEYRFDLYVDDARVDSVTAPGGDPTC